MVYISRSENKNALLVKAVYANLTIQNLFLNSKSILHILVV